MRVEAIGINNVSYVNKEERGQHKTESLFRLLLEDTYGGLAALHEQAIKEGKTWKVGGFI